MDIAKLACLDNDLMEDVQKIIEYAYQLQAVDTTGVEPFSFGKVNVFREDEVTPCLTQEEALSNAPQKKDNYFAVPSVFGG